MLWHLQFKSCDFGNSYKTTPNQGKTLQQEDKFHNGTRWKFQTLVKVKQWKNTHYQLSSLSRLSDICKDSRHQMRTDIKSITM